MRPRPVGLEVFIWLIKHIALVRGGRLWFDNLSAVIPPIRSAIHSVSED